MKLILPAILAITGLSVGTGAGIFMKPSPDNLTEAAQDNGGENPSTGHTADAKTTEHALEGGGESTARDGHSATKSAGNGRETTEPQDSNFEYVKLNNQFVVPVVKGPKVAALVVMSLSIEVTSGRKEAVFELEPKLRDAFLQVLFNHANAGGFDGAFTAGEKMNDLRRSLNEAAVSVLGPIASNVLVIDIVRQDV